MDSDQLTFELLKRFGNVDEVRIILAQQDIPFDQRKAHEVEAYLHGLMRYPIGAREDMGGYRDIGGGLDKFLDYIEVSAYFANTKDWSVLTEFINSIGDQFELYVTNPPCETYDPLSLFEMLKDGSLVGSMRRGIKEDSAFKQALERTVKRGYQIAFSHDIGNDMFSIYYPMLETLNEFIDPFEAVVLATEKILRLFCIDNKEDEENEDAGGHKKFFEVAIPALVKLTDEETVAQAIYLAVDKNYKHNIEDYDFAVKRGYIKDGANIVNPEREQRIKEIMARDQKELYPFKGTGRKRVDELGEALKSGQDFSEKFGDWFKRGKMGYLCYLMESGESVGYLMVNAEGKSESYASEKRPYNLEKAKVSLGAGIAEVLQQQDWDKLKWVLRFPEEFIDRNNPDIACLVDAYDLTMESYAKSE